MNKCPKCGNTGGEWYAKNRITGIRRRDFHFEGDKLIDDGANDDDVIERDSKSLYCWHCDFRIRVKEEWF